MILLSSILIPFFGGLLAWLSGKCHLDKGARWISLLALAANMILAIVLWNQQGNSLWIQELSLPWIPRLGIEFHLAADGLSVLMMLLTSFLGIIAILASWTEIKDAVGFFHFNLLWVVAGIMGVFLSMDLFLFYFFWELMLIPMYFLIGIWGHENRVYASIKFFLFTQAGGLCMLLSILGIYYLHYQQTGILTFDFNQLVNTRMSSPMDVLLMLGLFIGFVVKLPAFPVHTWLPDAHTEAPTAGSLILAGVLLKTGAYGILRFVIPLFPQAMDQCSTVFMILGVAGSLYGAILAFGQKDLKRLVAYSSVSHMGLVLVGLSTRTELSLHGVVMLMICHGLSTGGLFLLAGTLQELTHNRNIEKMGGLFETVPRLGVVGIFFSMATLGLPGLGNFIGEFLILFGSFKLYPVLTVVAASGLVAGSVYSLWIIQKVFFGDKKQVWVIPDISFRHLFAFGSMMVALIWLGFFPSFVINTFAPTLKNIQLTRGDK